MQHVEAGPEPLHVHERREPDRAVAVQLDGAPAGGSDEVRRELAHGVRRQQPARILQVEPVQLRAVGEGGGTLGVVRVRVHLADRVRQPDHDLLDSLLPRDGRDPPQPGRVVRRVHDLDPPDAVADDAAEHEPDDLFVRREST